MLRLTALAVGPDPVIAALQAPFPHYLQRPGKDAPVGYNWGTREHWEQAVQTHHAMLLRVLAELSGRFRIGPERTMLLGFSQPVGLNYRFVATYPGRFRSVVGICGGVPRDWEEPKYGPVDSAILHISRDQDEFYPVETAAAFPVRLRQRSADVEYRLLPGGHRFPSTARSILDPWIRRVLWPYYSRTGGMNPRPLKFGTPGRANSVLSYEDSRTSLTHTKPRGNNLKNQLVLVAGILIGAACVPVSAATVVATLPEFSGGYFTGGFPQPTVNVGTFNFALPAGDQIVSAMFNSTFGNSSYGNSAGVQVYLGNILAGTCAALAPCDLNLTPTPFSYVFKASDFASLTVG